VVFETKYAYNSKKGFEILKGSYKKRVVRVTFRLHIGEEEFPDE